MNYTDYRELSKELKGRRIRCINMTDDPHPIESGSLGTVIYVDDAGTLHIRWDNGRSLGMIHGVDMYEILPKPDPDLEAQDYEVFGEGKI